PVPCRRGNTSGSGTLLQRQPLFLRQVHQVHTPGLPLFPQLTPTGYLEALSAETSRNPSEIAAEATRLYVGGDRLRRILRNPSVRALYDELAKEDAALAEEGIGEYLGLVTDADGNLPE
ncbi:MAG TPA: hypothetical protein VGM37_01765, partial [Armatimonadota bacterium]